MKDLKYLLFKDGAGVPGVGSTHLGDKGIHEQFSDFIEVGSHYNRVLAELNNTEALNGTTPLLNLLTKMTRTRTHTHNFYKETFSLGTHHYRDWETDRKSTRLNSSHSAKSRMPSSA